ncbi:MAG: cobalamin-binding protein, partial [Dehalococcoidales bacterium]
GMKKRVGMAVVFSLTGAVVMSLLGACATPAEEEQTAPVEEVEAAPVEEVEIFPLEITDQLGRLVKLDGVPEKIISIGPSNTEILFALGLGDKIVAVTDYGDYPEEAKTKDSVGSYIKPNIELIVTLSPDVIFVTNVHAEEVIPALERVGLTVVALDPKNFDEVLEAISLIGEITGSQEEADRLVAEMSDRLKAITDKTSNLPASERPRVFYTVWYDPLMSAGSGTFQDDLIEKAGGTNITGNLTGWVTVSLETVLEANPEVMIAGVNHVNVGDANFQFIDTEPRLKDTAARQTGRVYEVDADLVSRTGPRLIDGLEKLAELINPELFGN